MTLLWRQMVGSCWGRYEYPFLLYVRYHVKRRTSSSIFGRIVLILGTDHSRYCASRIPCTGHSVAPVMQELHPICIPLVISTPNSDGHERVTATVSVKRFATGVKRFVVGVKRFVVGVKRFVES